MKKRALALAVVCALWASAAWSQPTAVGIAAKAFPQQVTVAQLPVANGTQGLRIVTDATSSASCTVGGGSVVLLCIDSGAWTPVGAGGGGAPAAHATTHQNGGSDEINVTGLSGLLADAQTPASHTHPFTEVTGTATAAQLPAATTATQGAVVLATPSSDTTAGHVVQASDARLSDARTPTSTLAHAATHAAAGSDPVTLSPSQAGLGNVTNDVQTKAAIVPNTAPSAGQIPVGNAGGTAYAPVPMSGDATLASTGAITVSHATSAGTATALAANGTNCAAGNYPLGTDASGNAEGCTAAATGNVVGPASSTDSALAVFSGTTGKLLRNSALVEGATNHELILNSRVALYGAGTNVFDIRSADLATVYARQTGAVLSLAGTGGKYCFGTSNAYDTCDVSTERNAAAVLKLNDALLVNPRAAPPVTCGSAGTEGVLYVDTSHALCYCNGTAWVVLTGAGTCA